MECPRCHANSVRIKTVKGKEIPIIGFVLAIGGAGLMFIGVVGLIAGAILGCIVGAIVKACVPPRLETYQVCEKCGYTSGPLS